MFEHSYYSVIAPEGCAAILWRDRSAAPEAAAALKIMPDQLKEMRVIDEVIPEPPGGAHRAPDAMAQILKAHLLRVLDDLALRPVGDLLNRRYDKFRSMGVYKEEA
jgi:acetyl-CoA carboxylase carboxyl transferase subunit alpha